MSMSAKKRNAIIAGAGGALLVAVLLIFLAVRGSGEDENISTATARTATTPAATQPAATAQIVSQSVKPAEVAEGGALEFTVTVQGDAAGVTLTDELGPATAGGQFSLVFSEPMVKGSAADGITTWTLNATASQAGRHRFHATATLADGSTVQAASEAPTYVVSSGQPPAPQSQPQPQPQQALSIVMQLASPETLSSGQQITFTVKVGGNPESVIMNYGPTGSDPGANKVLPLSMVSSDSGGVTAWSGSMVVSGGTCSSLTHQCYYTAEAFATVGGQITSVKVPNNGEWIFTVNP